MTETPKRDPTANLIKGPGPGRPKGVPNKTTTLLKDAILKAAANAGGKDGLVGYLTNVAISDPKTFIPLLGKVLPLQVTGENGGPVQIVDLTKLSNAELAALEPVIAAIAESGDAVGADQGGESEEEG